MSYETMLVTFFALVLLIASAVADKLMLKRMNAAKAADRLEMKLPSTDFTRVYDHFIARSRAVANEAYPDDWGILPVTENYYLTYTGRDQSVILGARNSGLMINIFLKDFELDIHTHAAKVVREH